MLELTNRFIFIKFCFQLIFKLYEETTTTRKKKGLNLVESLKTTKNTFRKKIKTK